MNEKKIKVYFVLPTLFAGGAERVISFVSQNLDKTKFDSTLVVIGFEKDKKYDVEGIKVCYLNKDRVMSATLPLIKIFRKEKPLVVMSAISHLNIMMGLISILFPKIKFIGRHTIVSQDTIKIKVEKKTSTKRRVLKSFDFAYKLLDVILCQSNDMYNDVKDKYDIPEQKLRTINNPITDNFKLKSIPNTKSKTIKFVTVARLKKLKGHKRILDCLSKIDYPFQYTIIGSGPEKDNIFVQAKELGIEDKITHIPYTNEVSKYLSENDFYLQASYAEGFPNCLIESCSVGTPAIAFKAPGGLNEIIEDGLNGFLVESEEQFIEKLNHKQDWFPEKIRDSVYKKFNRNKILKEYENLFIDVVNN
ncbi:glycosyltransferase [Winogradskyella alexanderae]|uniref:Glycosyltransferase n=1 Tax=Winogradskyella alexanderae TaxID=2877123 RepID=A0ABS7XT90_9FLAO|nr:glycosyltransferase [Winogradskyella alexanderae]MCA0132689.1 glycosyltransferase [Winogradskyella alexanderae]